MSRIQRRTPGPGFFLFSILLVWLTMLIHEGAHWLTGTALGYDMYAGLSRSGLVSGDYSTDWHAQLVTLAGPAFTLTFGLFGAWAARARAWLIGYELAYVAFSQRLLALVIGTLASVPNDEARLSLALGLPFWALPVLVCSILFVALVMASRALRISWLTHGLMYVVISIGFTAIIMLDGQGPGGDGCGVLSPWLPERLGCMPSVTGD